MKLSPVISSLLETDLYKFNMGCVISRRFIDYETAWTFRCRNDGVRFTEAMIDEIREQVDHYCSLRFKDSELSWLKETCPWLGDGYLSYLKFWHPVRKEIFIFNINGGCGMQIKAKGTWLSTSMYEIAILAIVSEVYFAFKHGAGSLDEEFKRRAINKTKALQDGTLEIGPFSEFGMRRRLSSSSQDWLISHLKSNAPGFLGTSNTWLAMRHGVKPIGTQAHEFIQCAGQGNPELNPAYSNKFAMEAWVGEYQTQNGIVLTDTIGTDCFLRDFNLTYANLFSGARQDSGDPVEWGEKMLKRYAELKIDPKTKTLLFSDSLDFKRAHEIREVFKSRTNVAFGIGTYLANDTGALPLNIVMKVTECNGRPVAKLSDADGKCMCDEQEYLDYLGRAIKWRLDQEEK